MVFELRAVYWASIGGKLATEIRVVILSVLIQCSDITVGSAPLTMRLKMSIQLNVVGKLLVTIRHPASMGPLLLALDMAVGVFLMLGGFLIFKPGRTKFCF